MKSIRLFLAALVSFVAGIVLFSIKHLGSAPDVTCQQNGQATSGFSITKDGHDCALSSDDLQRMWNWDNRSALPLHWAGLALVLLAIGLLVAGLVRRRRERRMAPATAHPEVQAPDVQH